ncbi:MAG: N-6 DNA methylase, partial [FCB group bacterium]|nr:N-6 DNA methylase [FCB group bacterium]
MDIAQFIAKWQRTDLKERSAAQEHFLDLCHLVGHPTPAEADPTGEHFCFERGVAKHGGGEGFADVWKRGHFGWEYKGKHKDLAAAYDQLLRYRDALENPPLLVVCDMDRIIVHTNFTGTVSAVHEISLMRLGEPSSIDVLRAVFHDPEALRPGRTSVAITQEVARRVAEIAEAMRQRGLDPTAVAHFLDRIVFCLFAEDVGLLPDKLFSQVVAKAAGDPARFGKLLGQLFEAMATGGDFGLERIRHFNGSLFNDCTVLPVSADEMTRIAAAADLDWSAVDPSIFGTLFERFLDPAKRSQLGAHFTGREDIQAIVDAVVMQPLRREWDETRQLVDNVLATGKKRLTATTNPARSPVPGNAEPQLGTIPAHLAKIANTADQELGGTAEGFARSPVKPLSPAALRKAMGEAESLIHHFLIRLQAVKVLDPACGSGNFLYVALQELKNLEKTAIVYAMERNLGSFLPMVGPWQLYGIEINPYAFDLAQMTVWIGWLQWIRANGFYVVSDPILKPLSKNFQLKDAILAEEGEPEWPTVDFIIGNPPFLGGNRIRQELGNDYVDTLFRQYADRVPAFADLCCYWFEKARAHIEVGKCRRAGLLATQGIRGGANREVLKRIKETGDIFWAVADQNWILDGANVHVSLVAFDNGAEASRTLDGRMVAKVNPDLTSASDVTTATILPENQGISFQGPSPKAPFDIDAAVAASMLADIGNPNGRPNSDVVRPVVSAVDIGQAPRGKWTIDFSLMPIEEAAQYEKPFEYVKAHVYSIRSTNRRAAYAEKWWQYAEARPGMRAALGKGLSRYIATPRVSKYRHFIWLDASVLANDGTIIFARDDDTFFGVLHSRIHEVWARAQGTQLREKESGCRYTPTSCFETFPMPWPPGQEPTTDVRYMAIAEAARDLVKKRDAWLAGANPGDKKPRTLTRLYNERPTWLDIAHRTLDTAVAAAYGWKPDLTDEEILERLLEENGKAAG